jgi:predicted TPR repeat methyltransferase
VQAFGMALDLLGAQRLEDARILLRRILSAEPDFPDALNVLGILCCHLGENEEAARLLRRAAELAPESADIHNNLGNVLVELRDEAGAVEAYKKAVRLDPKSAQPVGNLAAILIARNDIKLAEELLRHALDLDPAFGAAHQHLALILMATGRAREAMDHFWKATRYLPPEKISPHVRALAFDWNGERDEAIAILRKWLDDDPENPEARHLLSALIEDMVPERASDAFVERVFDRFADSFDKKLKSLEYRAPELVGAAVTALHPKPAARLAILDAGCGTGLCGPLVRPHAAHLVGVDLSSGMLAQARATGFYDELIKAELTDYLGRHSENFDLVICADTLCYFGKLEAVARNACGALRPGGAFIFTVEALTDPCTDNFRLGLTGRYAHAEAYLRATLKTAGLTVDSLLQETLRLEHHEPVAGYLVTAVRPVATI